jgi:hypothetical protein
MAALAVALTFMVLLLSVLVLGLLRSHADILRALHSLGAGIGDPAADTDGVVASVPITLGPPLPGPRSSAAPDIVGTTVDGDAVALAMSAAELTMLAFLSTGCSTCAEFWEQLSLPSSLGLSVADRLVIVTKGSELELPEDVRRLANGGVDVVLSTQAWIDYEVPGAPYFALVEGRTGRRVGEGLANSVEQIAGLIRRALDDRRRAVPPDGARDAHRNGPERESDVDQVLLASGIRPGDPSLYPSRPRDAPTS